MAPLNEESVQEVVPAAEEQQQQQEAEEVQLTPEQKTEQLEQLMTDGRRELRAGNFEDAGQKFGDAAAFAAEQYGEFAVESFEPNFMYGRSLVELSGIENDLMLNAMTDIKPPTDADTEVEEKAEGDVSMTEEEADEVREMVADALAENAEDLEKKKETESTEEESDVTTEQSDVTTEKTEASVDEEKKEEETAETSDEKKSEEGAEKKEEESTEEEKTEEGAEKEESPEEKEDIGDAEGDEDQEDEEEELATTQLAWEALEVASKIADKQIEETKSDEWRRKKADVFVQLAQCATNDENYESALEDLVRARELLATIESAKGDRLNAEIYFHEGRINRLRNEFGLAAESFTQAAAAMQVTLDSVKSSSGDAPSEEQKEEIESLEGVIADFKERAEDSKASQVQKTMVAEEREKEKTTEKPAILVTSNANSDATANDISGLVRKKRTHEESDAEISAKKSKSEEVEEKGEENIAV